jgi:hypothetical protein
LGRRREGKEQEGEDQSVDKGGAEKNVLPVRKRRKGKVEFDRTAAGGKRDKAPEEQLRGSDAW